MNKEILQEDKQFLEEEKASLQARIAYLSDPKKAQEDKLNEITRRLDRKEVNTTPKKKGNITMYQHLQNLKADWEKNGENYAIAEKQKLETRLTKYDVDIKKIDDDIKSLETKR